MQTQTWTKVLLELSRTRRQHQNVDVPELTSTLYAMVADDVAERCLETLAEAAVGHSFRPTRALRPAEAGSRSSEMNAWR